MTNNEEEQHHNQLLGIHRRNLRHIEQQIAQYGLAPPLHLLHALDHERQLIAELTGAPERGLASTRQQTFEVEHTHDQARAPRRSRFASLTRTWPRFRQLVWRTRLQALRWWQTGAIAFALIFLIVVCWLWKPTANQELVDQLRADVQGNLVETLILSEQSIAPARIVARTGAIVTLTITNTTAEPRRWLLLDGDLATTQFSAGTFDESLVRREIGPLQQGESFTLSFVPPHAGRYSFVSVSSPDQADAWGLIEVYEPTP